MELYSHYYMYESEENLKILEEAQAVSEELYDRIRALQYQYVSDYKERNRLNDIRDKELYEAPKTIEEIYKNDLIAFYYERLNAYYKRIFDKALALLETRVLFKRTGNVRSYRPQIVFSAFKDIFKFAQMCLLLQRIEFDPIDFLEGKMYFKNSNNGLSNGAFWACALSLEEGTQLLPLLSKMIYDSEGLLQFSSNIIFGMLASTSEKAQDMVMDLLKAAKTSEGLRQAVVSEIDFAEIAVYKRFLKYIVDENLIRFSSVKQSFSYFTGLELSEKNLKSLPVKIYECLVEEKYETYLNSESALDFYVALYALATCNLDTAVQFIGQNIRNCPFYKQVVCVDFIAQCNLTVDARVVSDLVSMEMDENLQLALAMISVSARKLYFKQEEDKLYYLITVAECLDKVGKKKPKAYQLLDKDIDEPILYDEIIKKQIDLADEMEDHYDFGYKHVDKLSYGHGFKNMNVPFIRNKAVELLNSSLGDIREFAYDKLVKEEVVLTYEEFQQIASYFKSKRNDLRKYISKLFLKAEPDTVLDCAKSLIENKKREYQQGGLVLLIDNKKRISGHEKYAEVLSVVENMARHDSINDYIEQAIGETNQEKFKAITEFYDTGYEPKFGELIYSPEVTKRFIRMAEKPFLTFIEKVVEIHDSLIGKAYEYTNYQGAKEQGLFGNYPARSIIRKNTKEYGKFDHEGYIFYEHFFPLEKLVKDEDLPLYTYYADVIDNIYMSAYRKETLIPRFEKLSAMGYFPEFKSVRDYILELDEAGKSHYWDDVVTVLIILKSYKIELGHTTDFEETDFFIDLYHYMIRLDETYGGEVLSTELDTTLQSKVINNNTLQGNRVKDLFDVSMHSEAVNRQPINSISLNALLTFTEAGHLEKDYMYQLLMDVSQPETQSFYRSNSKRLIERMSRRIRKGEATDLEIELYDKAIDAMLQIEMERTEKETAYSAVLYSAQIFNGVDLFLRAIYKMADMKLARGYSWGATGRKDMFSHIIYYASPRTADTQKDFDNLVKTYNISRKKLLEATMYNLEFVDFTEKHLKMKGLKKVAYYFKAHMNDELTEKEKLLVRRYTDLDFEDLYEGQMDIEWFRESHKELGKKHFDELYECAKYISSGAKHKRAQYFADAVLGRLEEDEVLLRIKDKRNQDMVLAYGLLPLKKSQKTKMALKRYNQLQSFIKESRQFGAQRRATELLKANIALNNLSRTYGFKDVNRFMWTMELELMQGKEKYFTPQTVGEVSVYLSLQNPESPTIVVEKNGKRLKNVPSKYKKEPHILELKDLKKVLKDQFSRARRRLEDSMIEEDVFRIEELTHLSGHPVIGSMMGRILFRFEDHVGLLEDGHLITLETTVDLPKDAALVLAHPAHLNELGIWRDWQQKILSEGMKQPFKQVFRELYVMTEDEVKQDGFTDRFSGYQIEGKRALGILKSRNWIVNEWQGFEKINHKHNLRIDLYSYADWFTPSEMESPSLERVYFMDNKTGDSKDMSALSKVIFSETMRDLDLVVSVAYVGGVDVQMNYSTIEMRRAILKHNLDLFKIENYKIQDQHLIIAGHYGQYSIHLGSGIIHKEGGGMLPVFPVHSQHRGHIFLPFVDEDPKTAELVSKALMLANDKTIKDPNIIKFLG